MIHPAISSFNEHTQFYQNVSLNKAKSAYELWVVRKLSVVIWILNCVLACLWCWSLDLQGASSSPLSLEATRGQQPPVFFLLFWRRKNGFWCFIVFFSSIFFKSTDMFPGLMQTLYTIVPVTAGTDFSDASQAEAAPDSWDEAVNSLRLAFIWERSVVSRPL